MIGQYADRDSFEGVMVDNELVCFAEMIDVPHEGIVRPIGERNREEECAALDLCTTVSRHKQIVGEL